jgi:hypothetical protein
VGYYFYFGYRIGYWVQEGTKSTRRRGIFEAIFFRIICRHIPTNIFGQWSPKGVPRPKRTAKSSQGIRGYVPIMAAFKFNYFLNWRNNVLLNVLAKTSLIRDNVNFVRPNEYLIKKLPLPTKRATVILINVKSL